MAEVIVHQADDDNVRIIEVAEGCLAFRAPAEAKGETPAVVLVQAVQDWRRSHRQVRIITLTPFVQEGNTVGYDLWYEPWIAPMTLNGGITTVTYESRARD